MAEREDLAFPSGGEQCAAWLYRPQDPGGGSVPCVVMAHGFSATRADGLPAYAERFAAAGFAVLLFDYRHFGDSGGEPRQLISPSAQRDDYRAAVAFARTLPGIDAQRIALFGSSFSGGHVVVVAAGDERIAAVVAQAPFADVIDTLAAMDRRAAPGVALRALRDTAAGLLGRPPVMVPAVGPPGTVAAMTSPDAEPGFRAIVAPDSRWRNEVAARVLLRLDRPVAKARRVRCPLLVCACDEDSVTPVRGAIRIAERAPQGELIRYPIGHFDIYTGAAFEQAVSDQTAFLRRHLVPAGVEATA